VTAHTHRRRGWVGTAPRLGGGRAGAGWGPQRRRVGAAATPG